MKNLKNVTRTERKYESNGIQTTTTMIAGTIDAKPIITALANALGVSVGEKDSFSIKGNGGSMSYNPAADAYEVALTQHTTKAVDSGQGAVAAK